MMDYFSIKVVTSRHVLDLLRTIDNICHYWLKSHRIKVVLCRQQNRGIMKNNVVFIGMPGVGKSTIGVVIAKRFGYQFIDSDILIQEQEKRLLKDIIADEGLEGFIEVEGRVNSTIDTERAVIATGGSVVYHEGAMEHLKEIGLVVYLKVSYEELESRLGDLKERGVALKDGQTLLDLYTERTALYEKYADVVVEEDGKDIDQTIDAVREAVEGRLA